MQDKMINKFIAKNHSESVFTEAELQVLRNGDVDEIVDTFMGMHNEYYTKQMQSVLKILSCYMGTDIEIEDIQYRQEYNSKFLSCQIMDGDVDVFLGIAGDDKDLLHVASVFSQEDLAEFDMVAYDALCELVNIMNGAFATKLSDAEIQVSLYPPVFYLRTSVKADKGLYVVTFSIKEHQFNLLMATDNKIKLVA